MKHMVLLLFLSSCSQLNIHSSGRYEVSIESKLDHNKEVMIEDRVDFYLWGLYPQNGIDLLVDMKFAQLGATSIADFRFESFKSKGDVLYTIISFGMYSPVSYRLVGNRAE